MLFYDTAPRDADNSMRVMPLPGSVSKRLPASAIEKDTIMANSNPPQAGQWFYIQSNLTDSAGNIYVANVQGANASPDAQIILWPLQPNSYNTLWKYENGRIVSALSSVFDPGLVWDINGLSTKYVVLMSPDQAYLPQWIFNDDGTISNQDGQVLDIVGGVAQSGASLVIDVSAQSPSQQWSVVYPQAFVPKWSYLQSGLPVGPNDPPLVATVQKGTGNVVLSSQQAKSSNQLWQITPDGRILSATLDTSYGGNPPMVLGPQLDGQNGNYIVAGSSGSAQIDTTMQWILNNQGMLINASNGLALSAQGSDANSPLITSAVQSGPPNNQVWSIGSTSPLADIMAAPPVPFPVFTGDQQTAYTYICQQLVPSIGIPDLRRLYTNLAVNLAPYLSQILNMQCPSGQIPQADWNSVVTQLTKELTAAPDIQALFSNYQTFLTMLFQNNGDVLNQLIVDAGMTQGGNPSNVGGIILSVFESLMYTGIEALPDSFPVVGNLMEAGISIAMSVVNRGGGSISPNPFQCAVSDLWKNLSANFQALLHVTEYMEHTILTDWGKMEAIYNAILSPGQDSLAWPDISTSNLVSAAVPGYVTSVMQMLLPAKYQIFVYPNQDSGSQLPHVPSNAQFVWQVDAVDKEWFKYYIAVPGSWDEYPSNEALNDVFLPPPSGAGVASPDFFMGQTGWGFARSYIITTSPNTGCGFLLITITNQTPNPLIVTASPNENQGVVEDYPPTIMPYGSVSIMSQYTSGLAIDVTITDPNLAGSSQVASFTAHQTECVMEAGTPWVDTTENSLGYQLTTAICNAGSWSSSFTGAVQIGICLAPINPPPSN
jgi:hypothetical protein